MIRPEVPSDDEVVAALINLGGHNVDAGALCAKLMEKGHTRAQCQLAVQRTVERARMQLNVDWTLSLKHEVEAA